LARNHQEGAKVAHGRKSVSLVAGNVTGGGGKATTTKTYWHSDSREKRAVCLYRLCADRKRLAASVFGIQKNRQVERVHARFATLKKNASAFGFKEKLGAALIYQGSA